MKVFLFLLSISLNLFASSINLDLGQTKTHYNRFSIPNNSDSQLEMPTGDGITSFRLTGYVDLASRNQFYFLLAPLEVQYEVTPSDPFTFNETDFSSDTKTEVSYKFNSYRAGYLWTWNHTHFSYWLGAVGKIRDARIVVIQNGVRDSYDNIGFVPLLALGFEWKMFGNLSMFSHTDALAASQGSAYDSQLEIRWRLQDFATSLGSRILGGGADNDNVYSFAQFNTSYLRFSYLY